MIRVRLIETNEVVALGEQEAASLVGRGLASYVDAQTATVKPPERAVTSRPGPRRP